jgi:hypothetical protein
VPRTHPSTPSAPCGLILGLAALLLAGSLAASADVAMATQTIPVRGGTILKLEIPLTPELAPGRSLGVRLVPGKGWGGGLTLREEHQLSSTSPGGSWEWIIPPSETGRPLRLEVSARTCSATAEYLATLEVWAGGPGIRQLASVPLVFAVERSGLGCAAVHSGALAGAAVVLLLPFYLWSMWAHSHFLKEDQLTLRIKPVTERDGEIWPGDDTRRSRVEGAVRAGLTRGARLLAWLGANPFRFGLPGQRYEETVEVSFLTDLQRIHVSPSVRAHRNPEPGKLYASATPEGPVVFGCFKPRPGEGPKSEEIGGLVLQPAPGRTILSTDRNPEMEQEDFFRKGWEIKRFQRRSSRR